MSDKVFIDSNIFLYAFSDKDLNKHKKASEIITQNGVISVQVINEVSNNMLKKLNFTNSDITEFVKSCYTRYDIVNFNMDIFIKASNLRDNYNISYYDSLIVSSAIFSKSTILYSEDMQNNLKIDTLTITNPFKIIDECKINEWFKRIYF